MIGAKAICDSINLEGSRLITMLARYPRFVHAEHLRHRSFSFSVSSSRAIPVIKNLEEVRSDELRASPVWWGREQKGMQSGEELSNEPYDERYQTSPLSAANYNWKMAALQSAEIAERLLRIGTHKSIANRLLEPFLHVNVLVTGTTNGWMNFFGLRLDRAAQPEIRVLAEEMWKVWNESKPQELKPGEWHLPFIDNGACGIAGENLDRQDNETKRMIKVSIARCARLSYLSFETGRRSTIEEDLKLYDRLVGSSPIHASPAEHQATPDEEVHRFLMRTDLIFYQLEASVV